MVGLAMRNRRVAGSRPGPYISTTRFRCGSVLVSGRDWLAVRRLRSHPQPELRRARDAYGELVLSSHGSFAHRALRVHRRSKSLPKIAALAFGSIHQVAGSVF